MTDTTSRPLISVVIPTHNRRVMLERALESVFAQTYDHLEIIVVDDDSSDDTQEFVEGIDDARVRYIKQHPNQGANPARNRGIAEATGEYIAFLDSDDEWDPKKLALQLALIEAAADPSSTVLFGRIKVQGTERPYATYRPGEPMPDYILLRDGGTSTITLFLPTELARRVRFDEQLRSSQEHDFAWRLERAGATFVFMAEALATAHIHGQGHVRGSTDYSSLLECLKVHEPYFNERHRMAFLAKKVAPRAIERGERAYGLSILLASIPHNVMPTKSLVIYIAKALLSVDGYERAREMVKGPRG